MPNDPTVEEFDAELSAPEREIIDRARDFGRRVIAPQIQQWEGDCRLPIEVLRLACAEGLAGVELARRWGGSGFRFSAKMRVVEELAHVDFGFAFSLVNHHNATVRISNAAPPLAERLVPRMLRGEVLGCFAYTEPGHGSDLAAAETSARKVDGGWVLDGQKAWITNAAAAGVIITLAQTHAGSGGRGMARFLVEADRPGFVRHEAYPLLAAHAALVGGFALEDYHLPDEALLDPPGASFQASLAGINQARCYVAAMCAGMLAAAIREAIRYGANRQAFGKNLIEFQGLRWSLVDAETDLTALRLLTYRAARAIDGGRPAEEDAARAKKFAGDRTLSHLAACIQAMGAQGLRSEFPLVRHLVACKTACFTDGTTEMMNERLGKLIAKRYLADA